METTGAWNVITPFPSLTSLNHYEVIWRSWSLARFPSLTSLNHYEVILWSWTLAYPLLLSWQSLRNLINWGLRNLGLETGFGSEYGLWLGVVKEMGSAVVVVVLSAGCSWHGMPLLPRKWQQLARLFCIKGMRGSRTRRCLRFPKRRVGENGKESKSPGGKDRFFRFQQWEP